MRRVWLLSALTLVAWMPGGAPAEEPDVRTKVDELFREYDRSDSPGCALGVFRDGQIAYARGYGMANLELGVALTPQSVLDIASMGKQFTAFSIHLLDQEGKLSLDDDIRKWVPEIPSYGKTVTIRHLLHHTGGLRDYLELFDLVGFRDEDLTTSGEALAILARQKAPSFAPGEEYVYSNTGYFLLSQVVARASGKSLREFAAERIFGPLGMTHTQYNDDHARIIPNRATGYQKSRETFQMEMSDFEQNGDGGVLTSVEDLQRWDANFYSARVGDAKLLAAMQKVGSLNSGKKLDYASGLRLGSYRGLPIVSHTGSWAGYRSQLLRFPEQRFSVACLCNNGGAASARRLAQKVAEVYLGSLMQPAAADAAAKSEAVAAPPGTAALTGAYRGTASGELVILSLKDGVLVAEAAGGPYRLSPAGPNLFRSVDGPAGIRSETTFEPGQRGGGRPRMRVTTEEDDEVETETFEPVEQWTPTPAELAGLAGTYASQELDTSWRLVAEGGRLFIRHRGLPESALTPTVRDAFTVGGMSLVFRRGSGRTAGFTLDEGRVRGVVFTRVAG